MKISVRGVSLNIPDSQDGREHSRPFWSEGIDTDQGNLTFVGDGYFPDLNVNSPRDLFMLRVGTVLSINGNPWMLIEEEARDSAGGLNRYWSCCNGTNLSHDELYVYALKASHNALACLHRA